MGARVVVKDFGFDEMMRVAQSIRGGAYAKVGVMGDDERGGLHATDPETGKSAPLTVAEIAAVNEFGTQDGHIPARSFVRSTFDRMRDELGRDGAKLLAQIVVTRNGMTVEKALNILGAKLATGMRRTIVDGAGVPPPNAPSTVLAKARGTGKALQRAIDNARTLVDTGRMVNAIAWGVVIGTVSQPHKFVAKGTGGT